MPFLGSGFVFVRPVGVVRSGDARLDDVKTGALKFIAVTPDVPHGHAPKS